MNEHLQENQDYTSDMEQDDDVEAGITFRVAKMPWIVRNVIPQEDWTLRLRFKDGKEGVYDMLPWIEQDNFFAPLRNIQLFMTAHIQIDSVFWDNNLCIAPEELYDNCATVQEYEQWRRSLQQS